MYNIIPRKSNLFSFPRNRQSAESGGEDIGSCRFNNQFPNVKLRAVQIHNNEQFHSVAYVKVDTGGVAR
jgi:hypothetical protein